MSHEERSFLPAAGRDFALPFYDPLVSLIGGDRVRRVLLAQAALSPGQRVLDLGCGTGTLLVWLKQRWPSVEVVGLDPDARALARAARKAERAHVSVGLDRGFGDALPYEAGTFDHVFSSYMLHHLTPVEKAATLREVRRVLKPGGTMHLLDFVAPHGATQGGLHHLFPRAPSRHPRANDELAPLLRSAGFDQAVEVSRQSLLRQSVAYYRALAPT